jgi:hypothetical protein
MKAREITCYVQPLSQLYKNGLERVELYVCSEFMLFVPNPKPRQRVEITFSALHASYHGGLRKDAEGWVYVCPNLVSARDGSTVSLASILNDNGIKPRDTIKVRVVDRNWQLA